MEQPTQESCSNLWPDMWKFVKKLQFTNKILKFSSLFSFLKDPSHSKSFRLGLLLQFYFLVTQGVIIHFSLTNVYIKQPFYFIEKICMCCEEKNNGNQNCMFSLSKNKNKIRFVTIALWRFSLIWQTMQVNQGEICGDMLDDRSTTTTAPTSIIRTLFISKWLWWSFKKLSIMRDFRENSNSSARWEMYSS